MTDQENTVPVTETPKRSKSNTPAADIDLNDLARTVGENWAQNPQITLIWMQQTAFAAAIQHFDTTLSQRLVTGSERAPLTGNLTTLDAKIKKHLDYLKTYLKDKFGKDSYMNYFEQFGIVKEGSGYIFPTDRNKRNTALNLTVGAIQAQGFEDKTYGLAFWQEISGQYDQLLRSAISTDSSVASLVSIKNEYRAQIRKTLNALIYALKANYPDNYQSVMRVWGFQKEKY